MFTSMKEIESFSLSFENNFVLASRWKFGSWNQSSSSYRNCYENGKFVLQIFARKQISYLKIRERSILFFFVSCCITNRILIFFHLSECSWWMSSFANSTLVCNENFSHWSLLVIFFRSLKVHVLICVRRNNPLSLLFNSHLSIEGGFGKVQLKPHSFTSNITVLWKSKTKVKNRTPTKNNIKDSEN